MNLIIDVGNTLIKVAVFSNEELKIIKSNTSDKIIDDIKFLIKTYKPEYALISQVGKEIKGLKNLLEKHTIKYKHLTNNLKLPFKIDYKTPKTLGADRIALVAGAIHLQPKTNKLIIDAGTCITYDFVDQNNIYHGGAISPGINLRFKSLNNYTAKLPLLKAEKNILFQGNDTKTSIQAGVIWGVVNEIEGFFVKYKLKYKNLTVFLTGGSQKVLERYIKNKIFVNSKFLLIEGMNTILNLNK